MVPAMRYQLHSWLQEQGLTQLLVLLLLLLKGGPL